jgi:hypothetical protein
MKLATYLQLVPRSRINGSIHPLPHTPPWCGASLVKHRDNFTFTERYGVRNVATDTEPDFSETLAVRR